MGLDIRYARSGGVSIAYQVVGDGDVDLAYVPDYVSNLLYASESRHWRPFVSPLWRTEAKSSSRRPSRTSLPARDSHSRTAAPRS